MRTIVLMGLLLFLGSFLQSCSKEQPDCESLSVIYDDYDFAQCPGEPLEITLTPIIKSFETCEEAAKYIAQINAAHANYLAELRRQHAEDPTVYLSNLIEHAVKYPPNARYQTE